MGQYKVPQDVESEDKLIGPLSFRQFIYVLIGLGWAGIMWRVLSFNLVVMLIVIVPVTGFFLLLGFGRRQEQSFEKYFIALIRFFFVPRILVWNKDLLVKDPVKAEKSKPVVINEKNISRNSLKQLAQIMDSYGNIKSPVIQEQLPNNPASQMSKRIVAPQSIATATGTPAPRPQPPAPTPLYPNDDPLGEGNKRMGEVGNMLQREEGEIHRSAVQTVQKGITNPSSVKINSGQIAQQQTPDDIIKKAMLEKNNLSVAQLAVQVNSQVLKQGQEVKIQQ